jgi:ubiquitin-conjugating enzyme E2 Q
MENCTFTGSNCIVSEYKQKGTLVKFLIECAYATLTSKRCAKIMKPIPLSWIHRFISPETALDTLEIMVDLLKVILAIETSDDDEKLVQKIGLETYGFIKFILSINKAINIEHCNILYDISDGRTSRTSCDKLESAKLAVQEKRIRQFRFTYSKNIESHFNGKNTVYRYHGTSAENLTPIMANGLKNCSGTDLMINGAVYGNGIYLSDNFNLSLGYCRELVNGQLAMLIYEVIDDPKWLKTTGIYVVDDENALILRYLIIINRNDSLPYSYGYGYAEESKMFEKLNEFLKSGKLKQTEIKKETEKAITLSKAYNRRLMIEYKKIANSLPDVLGFSLHLATGDNLRVWIIQILKLDNPILEEQMQRLNIPYVELEVTFPEGYPIDPPFPRILYPRFQSLTGHITIGGSICMEAISKSGWAPTTNMEALIMQIKLVLGDGKASIDETAIGTRYGMAEAQDAFKRAMAVHGW